jgi:hypothetical protein
MEREEFMDFVIVGNVIHVMVQEIFINNFIFIYIMKIEKIKIDETFGDQAGFGPWEYKGEIYTIVDYVQKHDNEKTETEVRIQRKSDGKFFKFTWVYYPALLDCPYVYADTLIEI